MDFTYKNKTLHERKANRTTARRAEDIRRLQNVARKSSTLINPLINRWIMPIKYKKKCARCKQKYIIVTWRENYPVCYDCQKSELSKEIKDPAMKKFFNIPEEFYKENSFLRNIKVNYLRYGRLTDPQIEAFKKTVASMKQK